MEEMVQDLRERCRGSSSSYSERRDASVEVPTRSDFGSCYVRLGCSEEEEDDGRDSDGPVQCLASGREDEVRDQRDGSSDEVCRRLVSVR